MSFTQLAPSYAPDSEKDMSNPTQVSHRLPHKEAVSGDSVLTGVTAASRQCKDPTWSRWYRKRPWQAKQSQGRSHKRQHYFRGPLASGLMCRTACSIETPVESNRCLVRGGKKMLRRWTESERQCPPQAHGRIKPSSPPLFCTALPKRIT